MTSWIFQGNPDTFDINSYLRVTREILWEVRQKHHASKMNPGDEVFIWRAAGSMKGISGVIAHGYLLDHPKIQPDDEESKMLWVDPGRAQASLRVSIHIDTLNIEDDKVVRRGWLKDDPATHDLLILSMANMTNYRITDAQALRLRILVMSTGR
jgi:predicted RNA-binding protein with PUA-like domain